MTQVRLTEKFDKSRNNSTYYSKWEEDLLDAGGHDLTRENGNYIVSFFYLPQKKYSRSVWISLVDSGDGFCAEMYSKKSYSPDEVKGLIDKMIPWLVSMASHGFLEYQGEVYE